MYNAAASSTVFATVTMPPVASTWDSRPKGSPRRQSVPPRNLLSTFLACVSFTKVVIEYHKIRLACSPPNNYSVYSNNGPNLIDYTGMIVCAAPSHSVFTVHLVVDALTVTRPLPYLDNIVELTSQQMAQNPPYTG